MLFPRVLISKSNATHHLTLKGRFVVGGHATEVPESLISTYSSVAVSSRDSVRIALTIAALNDLKVMACNIQNAYLTANCRVKAWTIVGPEFGSEAGTIFLLIWKALLWFKVCRSGILITTCGFTDAHWIQAHKS